jgi:hypothetical protein
MKNLEKQLNDYKKFNEAKNAFIAGMIMGWADQLESGSITERIRIIRDMKEFSENIAKSAGVIIADDTDL